MREIIYEQTREGLMEPRPTRAQQRRQREAERQAKLKRQKRIEFIQAMAVSLLVAALFAYVLYSIFAALSAG